MSLRHSYTHQTTTPACRAGGRSSLASGGPHTARKRGVPGTSAMVMLARCVGVLALSLLAVVSLAPGARGQTTGSASIVIDTETFNGRAYPRVTLENSIFRAVVRARLKDDAWGTVEHGIQDLILKANNQDQIDQYLDFSAQRGPLKSAALVYDGADYKKVLLQFDPYLADPSTTSDDGKPAELYYTIWPGSPVIRVDYAQYPKSWTNTVDIGRPGGTKAGQFRFYGGESWVRGYDMYPKSYWNTYAPDGYTDPANGGSLNYHNHLIMAVANPANGIGYGRVMPIYAVNGNAGAQIVKLLLSDSDRSGFETFPGTGQTYTSLKPFTGYLYLFQNGLDEAMASGKQIVDGNMWPGQATPAPTATRPATSTATRTSTAPPTSTPSPAGSSAPAFLPVNVDAVQFGHRAVGDVNGDGQNDIVAVNVNAANDAAEGTAYVYYTAPNWAKTTIRDLFTHPVTYNGKTYKYQRTDDMELADIDRDGDLDVVTRVGLASSDTDGLVIWLENPRPAGSLGSVWNAHPISGSYTGTNYYAKDIAVADMDRDGKLDVVTRWHTQVFVWFQDGPATWTVRVMDIPAHEGMETGDLDGDGDADIVLNGFYLKNPGAWSNPGAARTGTYTRYDIDSQWFSGQTGGQTWQRHNSKVAVGDLDGDGRLEVVITQSELPGYEVAWYSPGNADATQWVKRGVVARQCNYCHNLQIADFNKDGHLDVLAGGMENSGVSNPDRGLTIYYGDGGRAWTPQAVQTSGSYSAAVGDVGEDGDADIVSVRNWNAAPIELWDNQSGPRSLDRWARLLVDDSREHWGKWDSPSWLKYFGLGMRDVTGDGYQDIVAGRYFYRNPGGAMTGKWPRVDLGLNVDGLLFADVDGDAYGDILGTRGGSVYWLEALDGQGASWTQRKVVDTSAPFDSSHLNPQGYLTADLIPGGRSEIVLNNGGQVYYYQIPTTPVNSAWPRTLAMSNSDSQGIGVGDINRDGYLDLAAVHVAPGGSCTPGAGTGREIKWAANPQDASADWVERIIGRMDGCIPDRVAVADLNRDGRPDIVVTEEGQEVTPTYKTIWFEAPADPGLGHWTRRVITTQYTTNSLDIADVDRDGDPDVVLAEHRGDKRLSIFENNGAGSFARRAVDAGIENHLGARVADLDGDGDLDLVGIAWDAYQNLHVWRNDNGPAGSAPPGPSATPLPSGTPAPPTRTPTATMTATAAPSTTPPPAATLPPTVTPSATASPTATATTAVNLLPNPSFETDPAVNYFTHTNGTAQFTWAADQSHGGSRSVKIVSTGGSSSLSRWMSRNGSVAAMPASLYQAAVWVRTGTLTGKVNLTLNFWGPGTTTYISGQSSTTLSAANSGWTRLTVSATAPANAAYLRVEMRLTGAGTVWFDDVSVAPPTATAAPPTAPASPTFTVTPTETAMPTLEATATATPEATATDTPAPQETPTPVFAPSGAEAPPNGGFEAGTQPWVFWINPGAGGKGSLSIGDAAYAGAASGRVSISALPADRNVQLYQRDLALLPNTRYRLSFAAYSSSGRDMTVQLIQHGEPYANYGLSRTVVDLTNQWAVYTYEFTTAGFPEPVGDGRLKFFFGEHARKGDKYYLDEVSLSVAPADGAAP